jgi:hypothetical protein
METTHLQGALAGGIASILTVGWISLGTQAAMAAGKIVIPKKFTTTAGCPNSTLSTTRLLAYGTTVNETSFLQNPHQTVEYNQSSVLQN